MATVKITVEVELRLVDGPAAEIDQVGEALCDEIQSITFDCGDESDSVYEVDAAQVA